MPADARVTRWSFYNYILKIDPDAFAGRTNEVVCAAMEAEGIEAEVQYPSMNRYELFQPSLSRLPVAVEHADRLDPATMSFPVAEAAGQRESVYFMETTFRDGERGIRDAAEALAKIQANAAELPEGARSALGEEPRQVAAVDLEQRVEQRPRGVPIRDQRVRHQRLERVGAAAGHRRRDRQPLVGLGVRHEPVHLGRQRLDRQRMGAVAIDRARDLDDVVGARGWGSRRRCGRSRPGRRRCPACSDATSAAAASE